MQVEVQNLLGSSNNLQLFETSKQDNLDLCLWHHDLGHLQVSGVYGVIGFITPTLGILSSGKL